MSVMPRLLSRLFLLPLLLLLPIALVRTAAAQQEDPVQISLKGAYYINRVGNGRVGMTMSFSPPRHYDRLKRLYPNMYVLFRDFGANRAGFEITRSSLEVTADDAARTLTFKGDILGATASKNDQWLLGISNKEKIVTRVGNRIFTSFANNPGGGVTLSGTFEYVLPGNATIVQYNKERGLLTYTIPYDKPKGAPRVDFQLRAKKRLMAAVHKVYSDPEVGGGAYWVAKTVVKNTGTVPIYDVRISYRLGEYTEESVPEKYSVVLPQGSLVDVYYPVISPRVTQLRTRTPVELRIKYDYRDGAGRKYSDERSERLEILGINQFEYSNLSEEDRTDSWFDAFNNAPLLASFVTRNDDAVRQFAGMVSEAAEGAAAAARDQDARKWLKAAYEMQLANNVVYQTPSGFLTPERSAAQDLKYARDVFRDKSGTCIDLAITYAALAESVGLRSYLMLIPGHCFAVVRLPSGNLLHVENTGLGGGNQRLSFEKAVEVGAQNFQKALQSEVYYLVDVQRELTEGRIPNPELPPLPADFLNQCGIKRRR